jgi:hypothetical protein
MKTTIIPDTDKPRITEIPSDQPIVLVPKTSKVLSSYRILLFAACAMFMLAYAGVEIGLLMAVLLPFSLIMWIVANVYFRWGYWTAFWVGVAASAIYVPTWGHHVTVQSVIFFGSMGKISLGGLIVTGVLFLDSVLRKR